VAAAVVSGLARGLPQQRVRSHWRRDSRDAGMYAPSEYDLAGFIVGAAERSQLLTGKAIRAGDALLALPRRPAHQRILTGAQAAV